MATPGKKSNQQGQAPHPGPGIHKGHAAKPASNQHKSSFSAGSTSSDFIEVGPAFPRTGLSLLEDFFDWRNEARGLGVLEDFLLEPSGPRLPDPNPNAPRLSDSDYEDAAATLGVEAAAVYAVATVEAGARKRGFDNIGRPIILMEAHIFHKLTGGTYDVSYPELSQPTQQLGKRYYSLDQWKRMELAMLLDVQAAWESASWGLFQVMGFNHSGFPNVTDFVWAMFRSEYEHLRAFLAYCQDNNLMSALKNKDWAAFARAYNGKDYAVNKYDEKMQKAYERYAGQNSPTSNQP